MSRFREHLLGWFALVAYALTGVLSTEGVKLCFEPDGHLTIEMLAAGCEDCCPGEDEGSRDATVESCPCVDVAIAAPDASFAKTKSTDFARLAAGDRWSSRIADEIRVAASGVAGRSGPPGLASSPAELVPTVVLRV